MFWILTIVRKRWYMTGRRTLSTYHTRRPKSRLCWISGCNRASIQVHSLWGLVLLGAEFPKHGNTSQSEAACKNLQVFRCRICLVKMVVNDACIYVQTTRSNSFNWKDDR
jgi:hypothetical protein